MREHYRPSERTAHKRDNGADDHAQSEQEQQSAFALICLDELVTDLTGAQYLIKPFFERDTVGTVFGDSDAYKSFFMLDVGLHLATGTPYHGRPLKQCPVVYIAGEGHGGIGRRVATWLAHHRIDPAGVPFYLSTVPAELIEQGKALEIAQIIRRTCPGDPGLIVIDTLSTNIGNGDESDNRDMARLLLNVNLCLRGPTGACVAHVGHGDKDRERGAYAIRGNTDFRVLVKRDGAKSDRRCSVHCFKAKDGPPFAPVAFQADISQLPDVFDSEGEQATSLVLSEIDYMPPLAQKALPEKTEQCLVALRDMDQQARDNLTAGGYSPDGARVESKVWLDECIRRKIVKGKNRTSQRAQFARIRRALIENNFVEQDGDFVTPTSVDGA